MNFAVYFSKYMRVTNVVGSRLRKSGRKQDCPKLSNWNAT